MSPHNPIMEIHKKFSIPVACFVFALLGVGLGVSNRKDGKLASFVLGIGVIFVYYVIMFTARGDDQGRPGSRRGWRCGCRTSCSAPPASLLLVSRARAARSADSHSAAGAAVAPAAAGRDARADAGRGGRRRGAGAARPVVVIRIPHFELPRPNLLDSTSRGIPAHPRA